MFLQSGQLSYQQHAMYSDSAEIDDKRRKASKHIFMRTLKTVFKNQSLEKFSIAFLIFEWLLYSTF